MAAALCLGLLIMAVTSIGAQPPPPPPPSPPISTSDGVSNVTIYLPDNKYSAEAVKEGSSDYNNIKLVIEFLLNPTGATLQILTASDGGGCIKLFLQWTGGNLAAQTEVIMAASTQGISVLGSTINVNFHGCDESSSSSNPSLQSTSSPDQKISDNMTMHTIFIDGLTYMPASNDSEMLLNTVKTEMASLIAPTGATLEAIEFADGGGCLKVWLQMRDGDIHALNELLVINLPKTGIMLLGNKLNVSSDRCQASPDPSTSGDMTTDTLFLNGLTYMPGYYTPISGNYKAIKKMMEHLLIPTGAVLEDIDFADGGGCVKMWLQMRGGNISALNELLSDHLTKKGIEVLGRKIRVSSSGCNVTFCSFFSDELCGVNGHCAATSSYEEKWELCSCNPGFGGLFCENNKTDNMSQCEHMRRFNLFIHHQITGEEKQLPSMNAAMREIMATFMKKMYSVPYCFPSSNVSRDNYYSMADYDARNGQKLEHYCLSGNGKPNYWHYIAEDDCRVYSKYLTWIEGEMFLHNVAWSNDLIEGSDLYSIIKSQIDSYMSPAGGYLSELRFSRWGNSGCVHMHIVYRAERGVQGKILFYSLPGSSLMVKDENKTLSLFPCKEDVDINACPQPQPGTFSICLYECGVNDPCEDGLTCCNNSCGQGICKELGFLQKMKVSISMDITFMSDYEKEDSFAYGILKENVINSIGSIMTSNGIDGYKSVKLLGFMRSKGPWERHRKRRQAEESDNTMILLEFLFTKEIPVEKLMHVASHLRENGVDFNSTNYRVLSVGLGKEGQCGAVSCSYGSICVEQLGGQEQCVCPSGRSGSSCQLTVCQNPDGSSMCHNNAPCRYDEFMNAYRCHCETGFHGKYCETNVCDLFVDDACDGSTCVGDVRAMEMCSCPPTKAGLFCEYNVGSDYNQTYCEKHHAFASYVLGVLNGSNSGSHLSGNVSTLFPLFNATRGKLLLPTCRYDNPYSPGEYHYFCAYDTRTGLRSVDQDCMCANGDGSPNYWTFYKGQCVVYVDHRREPCDGKPCANGGVCHNMPNNDFSCSCPPGFHGKTCRDHHMDQCPHGGSPLYTTAGVWTCGDKRPCPVGFHCHGSSFNGSCCFKPDFLCDLNLCQNGSTCIGDLYSAQICHCPPGKAGLFCNKEDDGVKLTPCQKQQQFRSWLLGLVQTGNTPGSTTLADFRQILIHIGVTHIPVDSCDDEGDFKTKVDGVSVLNVKDVIDLCFDEDGVYDPLCKDEICDSVQGFGICKNGGRCIGDFTRGFCDCTGTGFHGTLCDKAGEDVSGTECTRIRDLFHTAQGLINGSVQLYPFPNISSLVLDLIEMTPIRQLFEPYCDEYGRYSYRGCAHFLPNVENKLCYCTSEDFQQVGDTLSVVEPPARCPMGPEQCPSEWGPDCERPDWWCTHEVKCKKGREKCYFAVECNDEECSKTPHVSCVPEELKLPCELQPCKHNKYKMCPPCGEDASCFHVTRDDNDSEEKHVGGEDDENDSNDSYEKHADGDKGDDDDDSDEEMLSWMKPVKGQNYICECPTGRSGPNCEVYDDICKSVPPQLCPLGCIGDLSNGVLCRCPEGYAGVSCEKLARTPCEVKEAFFGDSLNILRGRFTISGFEISELKKLVRFLVKLTGGDTIEETNCTENGFYEKIQCYVNVNDLDIRQCYCANQRGEYIASNIMPHIGYDVCTGPLDMRAFVGLCFRQDIQLCQNGGSCVFDLYDGKICDCPPGFSGQFCEQQHHGGESESFCEFMRDAYYYVQDLLQRNGTMPNHLTMYHYEILSSFLNINSNRPSKGYHHELVGLKMECLPDGHFKHYVCDHDLLSDSRIACYCLGPDGPLIGTEGTDPENLDCSDLKELVCHELDGCPSLECEHGHRHNLQYCPICECKHPCEGYKCHKDERCIVKDYDCDKDEKCSMPVCVPMHKPGVCPGYKTEHIGSIQENLKSSLYDTDTCQVTCHDDTDCEGLKKCCGLCGSRCVEPEESDDCIHQSDIMMEYLDFIRDLRNLDLPASAPRSLLKILDHTEKGKKIWIPSCRNSNYVPVQCMYNVSALLVGVRNTTECFCVDRLGHRIKDSVGQLGNESSCDVKPFSCPTLSPSTDDEAIDECEDDMDCLKSNKCCYDGFHHVCAEPVPEPAHDYMINMVMDSVCVKNPDICPGSCMSKWESDGKVCECGDYLTGPFCEIPVSNLVPKPRTSCERRRMTTYLFWTSFEKIMTTGTDPQSYSKIDFMVDDAIKSLLAEVPEYEREKIPIVMYNCDEDGNYDPMQCDLSMYTEKKMECFCVDEEGKELTGTRKPYGEQLPYCGRQEMCEMGHALHGALGNLVTCEKDNRCPYGYSCARSMYGHLYCCPNEEEKKDICNHPVDVGFECENGDTIMNYYYNAATDSCDSFNFRGCGGNRNRFESMDDCTKRCKDMLHLGRCPSKPFEVGKSQNCDENQCEVDADCLSDMLKCCNSTCGKRCIPAIDESPAEGHCPVGFPKSEPETCTYSSQCGVGYKCHFKDDDVTIISRFGYCCLDVENINYCQMRPLMMEKMKDNRREEKDDDDDDEKKDDSDEDDSDNKKDDSDEEGDDEMSMHDKPSMHCRKLKPRYYYNHELSKCEMYHGCEEDFNTFETRDDCCKTCSTERGCKEGRCPNLKFDVSVSCQDECYYDHDCPGKKICCNTGCSLNCVDPYDEMNSTCFAEQREAKKTRVLNPRGDTCHSVYMPECEDNGDFARQQCHQSYGICWCVTPHGKYLPGSVTRGVASCYLYTSVDMNRADSYQNRTSVPDVEFQVCPQDEKVHCCAENLCKKRCHAHPEAMCRINPCGRCSAEYFDADNKIVNCEEALTSCQLELQDVNRVINARSITAHIQEEEREDEEEAEKRHEMAEKMFNDWGSTYRENIPFKCQKKPETGNCKGFARRWFYDPQTRKCSMFIWGMCGGNANRFRSPKECYDECDPSSNPCATVRCGTPTPECALTYDEDCYSFKDGCQLEAVCAETITSLVDGIFIPRCLSTGAYNYKQCHGHFCWCVDDNGEYAGGLSTNAYYGDLKCTSSGPMADSVLNLPDCPASSYAQKPQPKCLKACSNKICPGYPKAECVVDLCSESCTTKFEDENGNTVDCEEDVCEAFSFEYRDQCPERSLCEQSTVKNCPTTVCKNVRETKCPKNPCAVCMVDPCTCKPYFVDAISYETVGQNSSDCKYLKKGSCDVQTCKMVTDNAPRKQLPLCTMSGSFRAKQCLGSSCYCVQADGYFVRNVSTSGNCEEIDEIAKIELRLAFDGDYDLWKSQGKLSKLKTTLRYKLINDLGVPEGNIYSISEPYKGSIKFDVVIQDNKYDPSNGNIGLIANSISQKIQNKDFNLEVDGEELRLLEEESTFVLIPDSLVEDDDDDDDGLSDKEIIIIAACCGGVAFLLLVAVICCCCCRKKKEPEAVDDTYDHIRETRESGKNVYDNPVTMYNNKSFETEGHYMEVPETERYMKVRL